MAESLRCAALARADGYRPAGTMASAPVYLLVEAPLPWPADVAEHRLLAPLAGVLAAHRARLQAIMPSVPRGDGQALVVAYLRPPGPFLRFVRHERPVPVEQLADGVEALLADAAAGADPDRDGILDVLVCTHGTRDVCCGRDGTWLYQDLARLDLPGARVWRTSHTGGHRFAPTALTFPDGRGWASADAALLQGVLGRSVDLATAGGHDRGCGAFADPFAQAAEGAVLQVEGWRWLDRPRTAEVEAAAADTGQARRRVTVRGHPDGNGQTDPVSYDVEVAVTRVVPVPDCGRPLEEARKSSLELEVVALDRV